MVIAGDWDGDGIDGFADYNPQTRQYSFYQSYNAPGPFTTQVVGDFGDIPIAGDWDNDGKDGFGLYRVDPDLTDPRYDENPVYKSHNFWFYNDVMTTSAGVSSLTFKNPLLETPKRYVFGIYTNDEPIDLTRSAVRRCG